MADPLSLLQAFSDRLGARQDAAAKSGLVSQQGEINQGLQERKGQQADRLARLQGLLKIGDTSAAEGIVLPGVQEALPGAFGEEGGPALQQLKQLFNLKSAGRAGEAILSGARGGARLPEGATGTSVDLALGDLVQGQSVGAETAAAQGKATKELGEVVTTEDFLQGGKPINTIQSVKTQKSAKTKDEQKAGTAPQARDILEGRPRIAQLKDGSFVIAVPVGNGQFKTSPVSEEQAKMLSGR